MKTILMAVYWQVGLASQSIVGFNLEDNRLYYLIGAIKVS